MARPPVEWPIPVYVVEYRERLVATWHLPPRRLAGLLPPGLSPELARGRAVVSLCLGNGRCLKPVGGARSLLSEFHVAEVTTPVRWQGACRAPLRGSYLLHLRTDSPGLGRLLRRALDFDTDRGEQVQAPDGREYVCRAAGTEIRIPRPGQDAPWPEESVFPGAEAAEGHLLHPECQFVPDQAGRVVRAVPVHHYARSTTAAVPTLARASLVEEALGLLPGEAVMDHALFQKRCTHTWFFPPERIPVSRVSRYSHHALGAR